MRVRVLLALTRCPLPTAARQWTKLSEELVPGFLPRVGVKLASDGENLYGFFGYAAVGDGNIYFDDVIRFDFGLLASLSVCC